MVSFFVVFKLQSMLEDAMEFGNLICDLFSRFFSFLLFNMIGLWKIVVRIVYDMT